MIFLQDSSTIFPKKLVGCAHGADKDDILQQADLLDESPCSSKYYLLK